MKIVIIQPPLVQLNTPYPAGAYLASFFRTTGTFSSKPEDTVWLDLSTGLFHEIFCAEGLNSLFAESTPQALELADKAEHNGDDATAFQLRRYVSESDLWCSWIDRIMAMVCSPAENGTIVSGHEWVHEFVRSAHAPRGMRMEQYLAAIKRDVTADDARILASLAFADIADYITTVYDGNFELIRYAEHLAASTADYSTILAAADSPVLSRFYEPLLRRSLALLNLQGPVLFCISVPFPGTLTAAIHTAQTIKHLYGQAAVTALGGGYVNTELRNVHEPRLFDTVDFISYDRGYGCFLALNDAIQTLSDTASYSNPIAAVLDGRQFYKTKYRFKGKIISTTDDVPGYIKKEDTLTRDLIPDYTGIDFSRSPRLADDTNPMHRIWSDGAWIKAYLAYGCYWHRCAFCDTTLEYVYKYCNTNTKKLYQGLHKQAQQTGIYGIHFVDEACPPAALQSFALANCAADTFDSGSHKLTFWGNIRFEKTFTRDLADLLSYGGMTGVSAGIEIATGAGLSAVNKGTDMEHIVGACAAFKEAGILVHSYMIYGFWNQGPQDLIDSMETLRQMFKAGLLDSAFWHKFTLTRHSTVFKEWQQGKHPDLHPLDIDTERFAENDMRFEGEQKSEKYGSALNTAAESWMHGEQLNKAVQNWFTYKMPAPSIPHTYIEDMTAKYEQNRDTAFSYMPEENDTSRCVWLGGRVLVLNSTGDKKQLCWQYMGNLLYADIDGRTAESCAQFLESIRPETGTAEESKKIAAQIGKKLFAELRGKGLCELL